MVRSIIASQSALDVDVYREMGAMACEMFDLARGLLVADIKTRHSGLPTQRSG